jgi:hypothetical protein
MREIVSPLDGIRSPFGRRGGSAPGGGLVTSIAMGGVTFTFSAPVQAGLDQTGRAYVVDPGAGVTVTAISPAQTTDAGNVINGASKNYTIGDQQGFDQRFDFYGASQNDTVPISLVAGDKIIKVISDLTGVVGDRDGNITQFACLHCVTTAPTATQVLGPSLTWVGDTTPEVYTFNLNAFYAARTTRSAANITWNAANTFLGGAGPSQFWPTFAAWSYATFGYQFLSPRAFGSIAATNDANYGRYIAESIGDLMLATTVAAGGPYTEAQIKEAILVTLMHGIEWGIPLAYAGPDVINVNDGADGGHFQFHAGPSIFALQALGLSAKVADLMGDNGGNWRQAFQITSLADFAPHTDGAKPWFSRERTLATQPGGSVVSIPWNIPAGFGASGFDMRRDALMPAGTRIVRKSDGQVATAAALFGTPDSQGNPIYSDITLTAASPFVSGDVVYMLPPVGEPLQVGSYDWRIRGDNVPANFSPCATNTYRPLQFWGGAILALLSHGMTTSALNAARGYFERARRTNDPSSTNDYASISTPIAAQFYTENWQPAWSILSAPSAFVVGNWTLATNGNVVISALPSNGGLTITSIEYRIDGGSWAAASGITEFSVVNGRTINFTVPSYTGQDIEIRAVNAIGGGAASDVKSAVSSFTPASLFAASEQGAWYDPSDLSTLWQNAARTVPVTTDGDPVRVMDDKSGNGRELSASSDAVRPIYRTSGGLHWLEFDGTDDTMAVNILNLSASDKVTIWAGVRRDSDDSGGRMLCELSASTSSNAGTFHITAPASGTSRYGSISRGSATINAAQTAQMGLTAAAPDLAVITATHDIAADLSRIWRNRVAGTDGTADKGSGNFASDRAFWVGSRNGSSLRFQGRLYSLIVRGGASTSGQIADCEQWIADKTGVTL